MTITTAIETDAEDILALQKLAYLAEAEIYGDYSIPPLLQTVEELRRDIAGSTVLKKVQDGKIIGSVRASMVDGTCRIGRLIVHPGCQNRGIGSRLMHEIESMFEGQCERLELFTGHKSEKNLALYTKLGYRAFRSEAVSPALTLVYLEKTVPR